jgi:dipeptidyl aminopeptidase/acylaminoacyl peptidase
MNGPRLGERDSPGTSSWLFVVVLSLMAGCTSNPSTPGGKQSLHTAPTSAASTDWDSLPVAALHGGRFTYGLGGDIWVMDADGTHRRQLTHGAALDYDPSWSPDGQWILFRTDRGNYRSDTGGVGAEGLFSIRSNGTGRHQIYPRSATSYGALFADWSPDGRRIALSTLGPEGETIIVIHSDGTHPVDLGAEGECADWSPDGRSIMFCSRRTGAWNTWVMNADGSNQSQLTTAGDQYPGGWSPDGRRIVVGDGEGGLVTMTPGGNEVSRFPIAGGGYPVAWYSPEQILLVSAMPDDQARWGVIRPDGTGLARLPQLQGASEADYVP